MAGNGKVRDNLEEIFARKRASQEQAAQAQAAAKAKQEAEDSEYAAKITALTNCRPLVASEQLAPGLPKALFELWEKSAAAETMRCFGWFNACDTCARCPLVLACTQGSQVRLLAGFRDRVEVLTMALDATIGALGAGLREFRLALDNLGNDFKKAARYVRDAQPEEGGKP